MSIYSVLNRMNDSFVMTPINILMNEYKFLSIAFFQRASRKERWRDNLASTSLGGHPFAIFN